MKHTYYVPIYKWGDEKTTVNGTEHGITMYQNLQDLYGFEYHYGNKEQTVVGYYEVSGELPTQEEFERQQKENQ
jgi:hypothetical protein